MSDKRTEKTRQKNEGEGSRTAARSFNQSAKDFAKSGKVDKAARKGALIPIFDQEELEYRFSLENKVIREWSTAPMALASISSSGSYAIILEVRDWDGGYGSTTISVTVLNQPPTPVINGPSVVIEDEEVVFFANASFDTPSDQENLTFEWYLGQYNSSVSTGKIFRNVFTSSGNYEIRLVVFDGISGQTV